MEADGKEGATAPTVRQQDFECDGPVEIVVELVAGRLEVQLSRPGSLGEFDGLTVQVRPDPNPRSPLHSGLVGLLSWLSEQVDPENAPSPDSEAVRETTVEFDSRRLVVLAPKDVQLRAVPLVVSITAPAATTLAARTASADMTVDGVVARLDTSTDSGDVHAQRCTGPADVRTGSGNVRLGSVLGSLHARTSSGNVDVVSLEATGRVQTGSGDVRLGSVRDDLSARAGSGDLTVDDAAAGALELTTGSGRLQVGVHRGVLGEVDLRSGSGTARSELPVTLEPGESGAVAALRIRGRTGSGDALVTSGLG